MNEQTKQTTIIMNPEIQDYFPMNANSKTAVLSSEGKINQYNDEIIN